MFSLFHNYLPLENGGALHLNKWISSMYFHHFIIISPLKRTGPFIWTKLNPLHPIILCAKFVWKNWPKLFWRIRFLNFVNVFSLFRNFILLEKGMVLHLNKFESPSTKDALCQVFFKLANWISRRMKYEKKWVVITIESGP